MVGLLDALVKLSPPLFGSLIGVFAGFRLDRRTENRQNKEELLERLKSIKRELETNRGISKGNYNVIADLQENEVAVDHYTLSLFETSAWEGAIGNQLVENLDPEIYSQLQDIYSQSKSLNEQIKRLRTEAVHPSIGEEDDESLFDLKTWTISVRYWDQENQSVKTAGLGELIKKRSNNLRLDIDDLQPDLENIINDLNEELERKEGEEIEVKPYFRHY